MISLLKRCSEEIFEFPEEVRGDAADAFARLEEGHRLTMPLSQPMPDIGPGCHELRLRHRSGSYRIIYHLAGDGRVFGLHAFRKKARQTPLRNLELSRKRLKEVRHETKDVRFGDR